MFDVIHVSILWEMCVQQQQLMSWCRSCGLPHMQVLCFTPTVENVLQELTYQCEVSNIVQTVTAQQSIIYPG